MLPHVLWGIVVAFLVIALIIKYFESVGGTLGDSSMVPGILVFGVAVFVIVLVIAWATGHFHISFD